MSQGTTSRISLCLLLSSLFLSAPTFSQEYELEIIQLDYRDAHDVIPLLRPHLADTDTITGAGNHLFLKAAPDRVEQIKAMLQVVDQRAKQLVLKLMQDATSSDVEKSLGIRGPYRLGDTLPANHNSRVFVYSSRANQQQATTYELRMMENTPAKIESGVAKRIITSRYVEDNQAQWQRAQLHEESDNNQLLSSNRAGTDEYYYELVEALKKQGQNLEYDKDERYSQRNDGVRQLTYGENSDTELDIKSNQGQQHYQAKAFSYDYIEAKSGFGVRVRIIGERAEVEIQPYANMISKDNNTIRSQSSQVQIQVPLNQWVVINTSQTTNNDQRVYTFGTQRRSQAEGRYSLIYVQSLTD